MPANHFKTYVGKTTNIKLEASIAVSWYPTFKYGSLLPSFPVRASAGYILKNDETGNKRLAAEESLP